MREKERDARRMAARWLADGRNVMTDDSAEEEQELHIATFASAAVAQAVTEAHNEARDRAGALKAGHGGDGWATEPWIWELAARDELPPPVGHEIMTARTLMHVAYIQDPRAAEHLCQIHNRLLSAEYGDPDPDDRLTTRWTHGATWVQGDKPVHARREIFTDDPRARFIGHVRGQSVAAHIVELHNRTFGDGQDGPADTSGADAGSLAKNWGQGRPLVGVEEIDPRPGETVTLRPEEALRDIADASVWAREFMKRFQGTQADESIMLSWFAYAIESGERSAARRAYELPRREFPFKGDGLYTEESPPPLASQPDGTVNAKRAYLPDDLRLSRRYGPGVQEVEVSIRNGVERLLSELVHRRVTEWVAREPARIAVDLHSSPDLLVNILRGLGYLVVKRGDDPDPLILALEQVGYQVTHRIEDRT